MSRGHVVSRGIGALLAAGLACDLSTSGSSGVVVQYGIGIYACEPTGCDTPDTVRTSTAAPGDTVWVRHEMILLQAPDSMRIVRMRPACAENVQVRLGTSPIQSLPGEITCPDSTALEQFVLGTVVTRFHQWALDPTLAPGTYAVIGRIMVDPLLEPTFGFVVQ